MRSKRRETNFKTNLNLWCSLWYMCENINLTNLSSFTLLLLPSLLLLLHHFKLDLIGLQKISLVRLIQFYLLFSIISSIFFILSVEFELVDINLCLNTRNYLVLLFFSFNSKNLNEITSRCRAHLINFSIFYNLLSISIRLHILVDDTWVCFGVWFCNIFFFFHYFLLFRKLSSSRLLFFT